MDPRRCMACWECIGKCPKKVIGQTGFLGHRHVIFKNADSCIGCNKCIKTCPHGVFFKTDATTSARTMKMGMAFRIERLLPLAFPIFHSETSTFFIHSLSEEYMYKNKPLDWLSHFAQHK